MLLTLAVIGLAAAAVAQEFIPIGGGSGNSRAGPVSSGFGEPFTPPIIDPLDPAFQPANIAGNRPNPIPLFPKTQQAGTPHEGPVDFTFTHQHSYKEPFRNDQFIGIFDNPVGAARPNIPRTLGRENVYIDPRTNPNSEIARAEAEKKAKNMIFYGLAPPVEKLHRADEFAPSSVQFQKPWDQWYDRFTESPALPRRQSPLTSLKRPNMAKIPFYAADRGKREIEESTEAPATAATEETTTSASTTTTIISDAIGTTTSFDPLVTSTDAAVLAETSTAIAPESSTVVVIKTTTSAATAATTSSSAAPETTMTTTAATTVAPATSSTIAPVANTSSTTTTAVATPVNLTSTAAPTVAASLNAEVVTVPTTRRLLKATNKPVTAAGNKTDATTPVVPSTGPSIPFRLHNRRLQLASAPNHTVAQRHRALTTKLPLRATAAAEKTTTPVSRRVPLVPRMLDTAVGAAKNSSRAATTKVPLRTTTFFRRPAGRARVPMRRLLNATTTATPASPTTATAASAGSSAAVTGTTVATTVVRTHKALNRSNTTTTTRTKAPFRIFSKRPLNASKLPARTPIVEEAKPAAIDSNSIGTLRTEVNRLLTTVVQLQSTVIAQQQRIALLENQLRLRRGAGRRQAGQKTTRFIAPNGRTVERTTMDIRKERSANLRNVVAKGISRQRSNIA